MIFSTPCWTKSQHHEETVVAKVLFLCSNRLCLMLHGHMTILQVYAAAVICGLIRFPKVTVSLSRCSSLQLRMCDSVVIDSILPCFRITYLLFCPHQASVPVLMFDCAVILLSFYHPSAPGTPKHCPDMKRAKVATRCLILKLLSETFSSSHLEIRFLF